MPAEGSRAGGIHASQFYVPLHGELIVKEDCVSVCVCMHVFAKRLLSYRQWCCVRAVTSFTRGGAGGRVEGGRRLTGTSVSSDINSPPYLREWNNHTPGPCTMK